MSETLQDAHVATWQAARYGEARAFLQRLDPEADAFTFQTFDDSPEKRKALAKILHRDLDSAVDKLDGLQQWRAGVFVTINATDGKGRQAHNVERVRALFVDLDGAPLAPVLATGLEPHIVVESSPGKWHVYWLTNDCPLDQFKRVQLALASRFGGDPSVHDLSRVMRLPGFRHFKGEPYTTRLLDELGSRALPYPLGTIIEALELDVDATKAGSPRPRINDEDKIREPGRHNYLFASGRSMAKRGLSREAVRAALAAENDVRCDPPLPPREVEYTVERAFSAKDAEGFEGVLPDVEHYFRKEAAADADADAVLEGETAAALVEREMPIIQYLNDPWIPEGLNLLVGRPKLGKSTLLRQRQAAVAAGGEFWGARCEAAWCIYLSLEEGDRLTRAKFEAAAFPREALEKIEIFYQWPRGAEGVLQLHRVLDARPGVRHVGIDSLTRFRRVPDARVPAFQADYEAVSSLHDVAKSRPGLAIDLIHHTRKLKGDDPLDDISGTYGLSAGCDSYAILRHAEDSAVLHIGGRLWCRDEHQFTLRRANQRWELVGPFDPLTDVQRATLEALRSSGGMSAADGAQFWGLNRISVRERLERLVVLGVASKHGGRYVAK